MTIPIVFSVSDFFVPYFSVCLYSLLQHIEDAHQYKIFILERNISAENKEKLQKMLPQSNVEMEFIDISSLVEKNKFSLHSHLTVETFFKLYIPQIFASYTKVLFCDADTIFNADPAELFKIDIGDRKIAAASCNLWNGIINNDHQAYQYTTQVLNIKDINTYFQGGVILFNNVQINAQNIQELLSLAQAATYICLDQDVLNKYFQDDVFLLDSKWNYETSQETFRKNSIPFMDDNHKEKWLSASRAPFIIHYSGKEKPWFFPEEEFADLWWKLAANTEFYQELLFRIKTFQIVHPEVLLLRKEIELIHIPNLENKFATNEHNIKLLFIMSHMIKFRLRNFLYRIIKICTFGKLHQKYKNKYKSSKTLLREAKKLRKRLYKA